MAARAQKKLKEKEKESSRPKPRGSIRDGLVAPIPPEGAPPGFNPPRVFGTPRSGIYANSPEITIPPGVRSLPRTPLPGPAVRIPPPVQPATPPNLAGAPRARPVIPQRPPAATPQMTARVPQMNMAAPIPPLPQMASLPPRGTGMQNFPIQIPPGPQMNPSVPPQPTQRFDPGPILPGDPRAGPRMGPISLSAGPSPGMGPAPTVSRSAVPGPSTSPGQAPTLQQTTPPIVLRSAPASLTPGTFDGFPASSASPPGPLSPAEEIIVGPQRLAETALPMEEAMLPVPPNPFLQSMGIRENVRPPRRVVTGSRIPR